MKSQAIYHSLFHHQIWRTCSEWDTRPWCSMGRQESYLGGRQADLKVVGQGKRVSDKRQMVAWMHTMDSYSQIPPWPREDAAAGQTSAHSERELADRDVACFLAHLSWFLAKSVWHSCITLLTKSHQMNYQETKIMWTCNDMKVRRLVEMPWTASLLFLEINHFLNELSRKSLQKPS